MKVHNTYKKFMAIIVLSSLSLIVLGTSLFVQKQKNISSTQATSGCFCNDQDKCYPDGCTRKPIKSDGTIDYGRCAQAGGNAPYGQAYDTNSVEANRYFCLQQPPCCAEMFRRNDPEACCWPEKGYCYETYCTAETTVNNNCGWYWKFHDNATPNGYGCMKGESPSTMQPVFGLPATAEGGQPTATPTPPTQPPTNPPTAVPTSKPNEPTYTPSPTSTQNNPTPTTSALRPTIAPTRSNAPAIILTPTSTPIKFRAPNIEFVSPKEIAKRVINPENIMFLNSKTEKALKLPSDIFDSIIALDNQLENYVNGIIQLSINKFNEFLGQ